MYSLYTKFVQNEQENSWWKFRAKQPTLSGINGETKALKKVIALFESDPVYLSGYQFKIVDDCTGQVVVWKNFHGESFLT